MPYRRAAPRRAALQDEPAYCGLASLAMTLNTLNIDPRRTWKGPWRWWVGSAAPREQLLGAAAARTGAARTPFTRSMHSPTGRFHEEMLDCCHSLAPCIHPLKVPRGDAGLLPPAAQGPGGGHHPHAGGQQHGWSRAGWSRGCGAGGAGDAAAVVAPRVAAVCTLKRALCSCALWGCVPGGAPTSARIDTTHTDTLHSACLRDGRPRLLTPWHCRPLQAACLARCNGARVELYPYGSISLPDFRTMVAEASATAEEHIIVSYSRKELLQTGARLTTMVTR